MGLVCVSGCETGFSRVFFCLVLSVIVGESRSKSCETGCGVGQIADYSAQKKFMPLILNCMSFVVFCAGGLGCFCCRVEVLDGEMFSLQKFWFKSNCGFL